MANPENQTAAVARDALRLDTPALSASVVMLPQGDRGEVLISKRDGGPAWATPDRSAGRRPTGDEVVLGYTAAISGLLALITLASNPRYLVGLVGCGLLGISIATSCFWWTLRYAK